MLWSSVTTLLTIVAVFVAISVGFAVLTAAFDLVLDAGLMYVGLGALLLGVTWYAAQTGAIGAFAIVGFVLGVICIGTGLLQAFRWGTTPQRSVPYLLTVICCLGFFGMQDRHAGVFAGRPLGLVTSAIVVGRSLRPRRGAAMQGRSLGPTLVSADGASPR